MKIFVHTLITMATLALGSVAFGGEKTYEFTGRVVAVCCPYNTANGRLPDKSGALTVEKGKEAVEINLDPLTKMNTQPKVGDLVTVHYRRSPTRFGDDFLTAEQIEVKAVDSSKK